MASADFLRFVVTMLRFEFVYSYAPARPPRVSVITFTSYICCIYTLKFGQYRTLFCLANSSISKRLFLCSFCSSDRGFASDFFQTPPHDGRPCLWLTVPTATPVADFLRQVITRAEHTKNHTPIRVQSNSYWGVKNSANVSITCRRITFRDTYCKVRQWRMLQIHSWHC